MVADRNPSVWITAIDLSGDMLIQAGRNTHTQQTQLIRYDIKRVFGNAPDLADLVFSRNMLHRVEILQEGLLAMARACKRGGGIMFSTSFRNCNDLDAGGRQRWVADFNERDGYPALQRAWTLAYQNAPTLAQYQAAARRVAYLVDANVLQVMGDKCNAVNIFLKR